MAQAQRRRGCVKPDAVDKGVTSTLEPLREGWAGDRGAEEAPAHRGAGSGVLYAVHKERSFSGELVDFMTSGPVVVGVLEGPDAIAKNRELMGPTDSTKAEPGTIRGDFGTNIERNAVHGSDAPETARVEITYFFNAMEIMAPVEALPA